MSRARTAAALLALLAACACSSLRAARLYTSGSDALERGEVARAVAELERAAALAPELSEIQNHLGLAYAAAGRRDAAREAFARAVALDCASGAARHNLAAAGGRAPEEQGGRLGSRPTRSEPQASEGRAPAEAAP
jgi:Flp pilus assembly protein TadD